MAELTEFDWLDADTPTTETDLLAALDALTDKQREWLHRLADQFFNVRGANDAARRAGIEPPSANTLWRWRKDPRFVAALNAMKAYAVEASGVEAKTILLRLDEVARFGLERLPVYDDDGELVDNPMRDGKLAVDALKTLSSMLGIGGTATAQAVGVNIDFRILVNEVQADGSIHVIERTMGTNETRLLEKLPGNVIEGEAEHVDKDSVDMAPLFESMRPN